MTRCMVIASVLLFFCTACGAGQTDSVQTGSSLGEADPLLQSLDQTAVEQQLKASADPGAAYLLAELYNSTGRPENAFSGYLKGRAEGILWGSVSRNVAEYSDRPILVIKD